MPTHFEGKENKGKAPIPSGQLRAGKPREWYDKLMREEPKPERKGEPHPNITRERIRPSAYSMMMKGNFPEFKDYSILHPDDLQFLVCAYLAFGKLSEAAAALKAYGGVFITLSKEQCALLEKAIKGNANIADFFEKTVLEKFEPDGGKEILRLLIANKKMAYSFLTAHEGEVSKDDFRKVIVDLGIDSITLKELDSLKLENRNSVLEFLISRGKITYSLFISYSHELGPDYFNTALIGLLERDEMWIDEAIAQDPEKLDRRGIGKCILKKVDKGKMTMDVALEKYGNIIDKTDAGEEIVMLVSKKKAGIDYAMRAFAAGWLNEKQLRNAIIKLSSQKQVTIAEVLSKYDKFFELKEIEELVLEEIRLGNKPTAVTLKHSKEIGLEKIKGAIKERYLQTKKKEKENYSNSDRWKKWLVPGAWAGGVLGMVGTILGGILSDDGDMSTWIGAAIIWSIVGAAAGAAVGDLIVGKMVISLKAGHQAREEMKELKKLGWTGGRKWREKSMADAFKEGSGSKQSGRNAQPQLRAGKPREWYEKLMREEPKPERKGEPRPEIRINRIKPKDCDAIWSSADGAMIRKIEECGFENLHPQDLQLIVFASLKWGMMEQANLALAAYAGNFPPLADRETDVVQSAAKNDLRRGADFFKKGNLDRLDQKDRHAVLIAMISAHGMDEALLEAYAAELDRKSINDAIFGMISKGDMWIDDAYKRHKDVLDFARFGDCVCDDVIGGKLRLQDALEKYPEAISRSSIGYYVMRQVADKKITLDGAIQKYGKLLGKKHISDYVVRQVADKKITVGNAIQKYGKLLDEKQVEEWILNRVRTGTMPESYEEMTFCMKYGKLLDEKQVEEWILNRIRTGTTSESYEERMFCMKIDSKKVEKALRKRYSTPLLGKGAWSTPLNILTLVWTGTLLGMGGLMGATGISYVGEWLGVFSENLNRNQFANEHLVIIIGGASIIGTAVLAAIGIRSNKRSARKEAEKYIENLRREWVGGESDG